jgi:hypothetical protein
VVTVLHLISTCEWYLATLIVKNRHQKDISCHVKIGLCAQNVDTILGLILNTIGSAYVTTQRESESSL